MSSLEKANTDKFISTIIDEAEDAIDFQSQLAKAIWGFKSFYDTPTQMYREVDVFDPKTKKITKKTIKEDTLYQYQEVNQEKLHPHRMVIHAAMSSVLEVTTHIRAKLYQVSTGKESITNLAQQTAQLAPPQGIQFYPIQAEQQQKPGWFDKLFSKKPEPAKQPDTPYWRVQKILEYLEEIPDKFSLICEYHDNAINNCYENWSTNTTIEGMLDFKKMLSTVFSYWVEPRLVAIYQYNYILIKERAIDRQERILVAKAHLEDKYRNDIGKVVEQKLGILGQR